MSDRLSSLARGPTFFPLCESRKLEGMGLVRPKSPAFNLWPNSHGVPLRLPCSRGIVLWLGQRRASGG